MKRVFLSYGHTDLVRATRLYRDLAKSANASVWFDENDLKTGLEWEPAIFKAIRESDYFVALLSKQSVTTKGFRHTELRKAIDIRQQFPEGQSFLCPVRLDDCATHQLTVRPVRQTPPG